MVSSPASASSHCHNLGVQVPSPLLPQTQKSKLHSSPFSESRSPGSLPPPPEDPQSFKPEISLSSAGSGVCPSFLRISDNSCLAPFDILIHNFLSRTYTLLPSKPNHVLHTQRPALKKSLSYLFCFLCLSPTISLSLHSLHCLASPHPFLHLAVIFSYFSSLLVFLLISVSPFPLTVSPLLLSVPPPSSLSLHLPLLPTLPTQLDLIMINVTRLGWSQC